MVLLVITTDVYSNYRSTLRSFYAGQPTTDKNQKLQGTTLAHGACSFSYIIQYLAGHRNVAPDTFTRAYCSATTVAPLTSSCVLQDIRDRLCQDFPNFFGHGTLRLIILACGILLKIFNTGLSKRNKFQFCTFLSKKCSYSHMEQQ